MSIAICLAAILGSLAAYRPNSLFDRLVSFLTIVTASIPPFWISIVAILVFSMQFGWLPTSGIGGVRNWILPVGVLVLSPVGLLAQVVRTGMLSCLNAPYVKTAISKGASTPRIIFVHALRNALLPLITVAGIQATSLINGAVVVETIFGFPGIGNLMIESVRNRDFELTITCIIVTAIAVGWQIAEVCRIHGSSRADADRRAVALLGRVGIPDPEKRKNQYPHEFSGGQRQRIMIAMSMAMKPALLIADEPTTALDVTVQAQILDLLRDIQAETGTSILMITHDLGVAADVANRVFVMREGEMVETGTIRDVLLNPKQQYTRDLIAAGEMTPGPSRKSSERILEVSEVSLQYGETKVVHNISLTLHKGEIMCIVGESGSGKSTLARSILRLMAPSSGEIKFHGKDVAHFDSHDVRRYQRAVQAVFQDPYSSLNPRMKVMDIIAEPWTIQKDILPPAEWRERAGDLLRSVGLATKDLDKFPGEFSGGQRQRIAIARALAMSSEIIVCDEAVSALDLTIQAQVIALLRDLRDRLNVALIFICHDLNLVRSFADSVLVMQDGRVVEQGPASTLFDAPRHPYTQRLIAASPVIDPVAQSDRRQARALLD